MTNMESSPLLRICEEERGRVLQVPLAGRAPHPPPLRGDRPVCLSRRLSRTGRLYLVLSGEAPVGFQLVRCVGLAPGGVVSDGRGVDESGHQRAQDDPHVDDAADLHLCGPPRISRRQLSVPSAPGQERRSCVGASTMPTLPETPTRCHRAGEEAAWVFLFEVSEPGCLRAGLFNSGQIHSWRSHPL